MTDPKKSAHQPDSDVWQPTVDLSAKDANDEKSAASDYDKIYGGSYKTGSSTSNNSSSTSGSYTVPTLSAAYTEAPGFFGAPRDTNGPVSPPTNPPAPPGSKSNASGTQRSFAAIDLFVDLKALRTLETSYITTTQRAVTEYEKLRQIVVQSMATGAGTVDTFGQAVGKVFTDLGPGPNDQLVGDADVHTDVKWDPLDDEGKQFAASIEPQMQYLLQMIGNSIETLGTFTALLNNAGQIYAQSDAQSAFPNLDPGSASAISQTLPAQGH
jgi:hypothetical protein